MVIIDCQTKKQGEKTINGGENRAKIQAFMCSFEFQSPKNDVRKIKFCSDNFSKMSHKVQLGLCYFRLFTFHWDGYLLILKKNKIELFLKCVCACGCTKNKQKITLRISFGWLSIGGLHVNLNIENSSIQRQQQPYTYIKHSLSLLLYPSIDSKQSRKVLSCKVEHKKSKN